MKKYITIFLVLLMVGVVGCGNTKEEKTTTLNNQATETELKNHAGVLYDYYKDASDVWHADGREYKYKVVLTGKLPNAAKKSQYVVLTNDKDISFNDAADDILSNNSEEHFDKNKAIIVEME